jgi:hypothetical protein
VQVHLIRIFSHQIVKSGIQLAGFTVIIEVSALGRDVLEGNFCGCHAEFHKSANVEVWRIAVKSHGNPVSTGG